jgi:hypothetical protein
MKGTLVTTSELDEAVKAERRAAEGKLSVSVSDLVSNGLQASADGRLTAATWYRLKAAEILCFDCRYEEAWEFYEQIAPDLEQVPDRLQTSLQRNFSFVGLVIGKNTYRSFYESVDRASGQPDRTARATNLLAAEQASRKRAHYDSIPALWRELKLAYIEADWTGRKRAHDRLAWETLQAGRIRQGVHHSLYGENKESIDQLATWLIKWRKLDLIESASLVAVSSKLLKHAEIGAQLVGQLADVLPDHHIERSIDWALRILKHAVIRNQAMSAINSLWLCLHRLAFRFSSDQARVVIDASIGHPLFSSVNSAREAIAKLVLACLNKVRNCDYVLLARQVLPLATTLKSDIDFKSIIDLLTAIADKSLEAKAIITEELLPHGQTVSELTLLTHLTDFGRPPQIEFCERVIHNIAECVGDQVWVGDGAPPTPRISSFGTMDSFVGGQAIRVAVSGGAQELNLIAGFGELLNASFLEPLIAPAVRTLQHPFNTSENRLLLLQFLYQVRAHLSQAQADIICKNLLPLARGHYKERSPFDLYEESTLSRFNIRGVPSLAQERGAGLFTLVFVAARFEPLTTEVMNALDESMLDADSELRESGFRALTALSELSSSQKLYLLSGLQDSEIETACSACEATRVFLQRGSLSNEIPNILVSAHLLATSQAPKIRFSIARVLDAISDCGLPADLRGLWEKTIRLLKSDTHYSVRSVVSHLGPVD